MFYPVNKSAVVLHEQRHCGGNLRLWRSRSPFVVCTIIRVFGALRGLVQTGYCAGHMLTAQCRSRIGRKTIRNGPVVAPVGPLATINCEPRQTRKGAAAAMDSGAGVWRAGVTSI